MSELSSMRLDVWLWRSRFFKTRSLAATSVEATGVRISRNGLTRRVDKPSVQISVGDLIAFTAHDRLVALEVVALPERRGPASEARGCYRLPDGAAAVDDAG